MARRLAGAVVALSAADAFAKRDMLPVVAGRLPLYDGKKCSSGTFAAVT